MALIIAKETLLFGLKALWIFFMAMIILMVVASDIARETKGANLQANTLIKKALYSADCFVYEDVRARPLVIDVSKFTKERINKCIDMDRFSARFRLYYGNETKEIINNEARFLVDTRLCYFKNYECVDLNKSILIYNGSDIIDGRIHINATQSDI